MLKNSILEKEVLLLKQKMYLVNNNNTSHHLQSSPLRMSNHQSGNDNYSKVIQSQKPTSSTRSISQSKKYDEKSHGDENMNQGAMINEDYTSNRYNSKGRSGAK